MADLVGQQLGHYRVLRLLGRGGFAEVYLGEHAYLKNHAALKVLHARLGEQDTEQFLREAQTLARLDHPHIVRVLDFAVQDGTPFLVMEYATGGTLRQRHPAGTRVPYENVITYVTQVASALQYAHNQRLMHRDVKPENMLLGGRSQVLLSDFGLAMLMPSSLSMGTQEMDESMAGTTPYLAPEQLQGRPQLASDQYALGIVVYEWLCGRRPFSGSPLEVAMQHRLAPVPPLREDVPDLPPAIEEVVVRALAKEPEHRFASVQDFATALRQAAHQAGYPLAAPVIPSESAAGIPHPASTILAPLTVSSQERVDAQNVITPGPGAAAAEQKRRDALADKPAEPLWKVPTFLTPLVGREQEVAAVCAMLSRPEVRLLTLLGVGGIGKTRLAIQVTSKMRGRFADGVCFVALASIRDPDLVMPSIAYELGVHEGGKSSFLEAVKAYARDRQLFLLLDNFEQVITAAPMLEDLLAACPRLAILVTSREVLRLQAEYLFPVPPLTLPNLEQLPENGDLAQYASVSLFVQRAQAVKPDFTLTRANSRAIAEICVRLDGLPLALELAAARVRLLPPQALLARLSQRFQVLTGGPRTLPERQQTLRDTVKWSYDLLDAREQRLFRRLSVFIGGWTLEAVEAVCYETPGAALAALDEVTSLLDKSLLLQVEEERGEPRLQMLMTVREYARECLQASGETEQVQQAHAAYYLAWVEEAERHLKGAAQLEWLARLELELANVFAALETASARGIHAQLVQSVKGFTRFLEMRGAYAQAETHLKRAEQAARSLKDWPGLATTLFYLGEVAEKQGNYLQAETYLQEGLALAREIGDRERTSDLLRSLSMVVRRRGDYDLGEVYMREGLTLAREIGDRERTCSALRSMGAVVSEKGDFALAETYFQEGLILARELGDREQISVFLTNLGYLSVLSGNRAQAEVYMQEGLALARQIGYREGQAVLLSNLADLAGEREDYAQAETYFREAFVLAGEMGDREQISIQLANLGWVEKVKGNFAQAEAYIQEGLALARQIDHHWAISVILNEAGELHLKQQLYDAALADYGQMREIASEGNPEYLGVASYGLARVAAAQGNIIEARQQGQEALAILEKIGYYKVTEIKQWLDTLPDQALPPPQSPTTAKKTPFYPADLTAREVEVLRLVAQGLTDAQVAGQLVVSPRTINWHLTSIYGKLGVSSRAAATRYALEYHLV